MSNSEPGSKRQQNRLADFVWPIVMIGSGIYWLNRPTHTTGSRVLSWAAIALGATLLLANGFLGFFKQPEAAARDIEQQNRDIYKAVHERRIVDDQMIEERRLDARFYRETTEQLQALGFRHLNDFIDVTIEQAMPSVRTVIRAFLSRDGQTMGAAYDCRTSGVMRLLQLVGLLPRIMRGIDMETELSDGTFVTTSTAALAGKASEFPGISRVFLAVTAAPAELMNAHAAHLKKALHDKAGAWPVVLHTFEDLSASQARLTALKSQHRNSADYDPAANIERIAGKPLTSEQKRMAEEARALHAQRVAEETR